MPFGIPLLQPQRSSMLSRHISLCYYYHYVQICLVGTLMQYLLQKKKKHS